ncbi:MAG: type II secretion system protein N [Candidatus Euphemobacter frigidus]|nr:type II secretion system protein N [Candidatus Euphemobacter frigidus]MDP8276713.1 type II secretion system protein N [Candidatus Euphemobacter frigidus]
MLINLVLAVLLVTGSGYLAWTYYQDRPVEDDWASPDQSIEAEAVPTPPGESYYEVIVSRDLWREKFAAPEEAPPPTPRPQEVPPPKLNLLGTTVRADQSKSLAFIEEVVNKKQDSYRVGDSVAEAVVLEIERNQVVMDFKGNVFTLTAFKDSIKVNKGSIPLSRILRPVGKNKWLISKKGLWQLIANNKWLVSKKGLWKYIKVDQIKVKVDEVVAQIMKALSGVGCRPYYPPGKPRRGDSEGYEILILPPRHLSTYLGIKKGDIIRTVNEKMITGKKRALELLQEVQTEKTVIVEIKRQSELLQLEYMVQVELLELE